MMRAQKYEPEVPPGQSAVFVQNVSTNWPNPPGISINACTVCPPLLFMMPASETFLREMSSDARNAALFKDAQDTP